MQRFFLTLFIIARTLTASANWTPVTTGINDDFNDIYFWNNNEGIVIGNKGIYYTLTGGNTAASWTRFTIPGNTADNALYDRCRFVKMAALFDTREVYMAGYDTVNHKAVIFYFQASTLSYSFCYTSAANSVLNDIRYDSYRKIVFAVGNAGLLVGYNTTSRQTHVYPAFTTKTLQCLSLDDYASSYLNLGGDGIYIRLYLYGDAASEISSVSTDFSITSIESQSGQLYVTSSKGFYQASTDLPVQFTELKYRNSSLHAIRVVRSFTRNTYFIVTSQGIFRKYQSILEIQPASTGYALNALNVFADDGLAAGCGNKGLLVKSNNGGGGTTPYLDVYLRTGCKGDQLTITRQGGGSATSCDIKVFNASNEVVYQSNTFALNLSTNWDRTGEFSLQYIVRNAAGLSDTVLLPMSIPEPPAINMPVTISDNILCKKEQVLVTVAAAPAGWNFVLRRAGDDLAEFGSAAGNDATIQFQSRFIEKTDNYYIRIQHQKNGCYRNFTDLIPVTVEQTKGRLASEFINSFTGENVQFNAISNDAQNYKWNFDGSASQTVVHGKRVEVSFKSEGEKWVLLESWSNNGCYDTTLLKATRVVTETNAPADCFALNVPAEEVAYNVAGGVPLMRDMELTSDGILLAGGSYKYILRSLTGDSLNRTDYGGSFLAKYSKKGTLRWRVYSRYPNYTCPTCYYSQKPALESVEALSDGSTLFAGNDRNDTWMYFNSGDSIKVASGSQGEQFNGYLVKLDSRGSVLWHGMFVNAQVKKMKEDKFGNIWLLCSRGNQVTYMRSGHTGVTASAMTSTADYRAVLIKLNSNGNFLQAAPIDLIGNVNTPDINDLVIDNDGNAWLTGVYNMSVNFYNNNNSAAATINRPGGTIAACSFIVKYSAACNYLLHINGAVIRSDEFVRPDISASKIAVDSLNNIYVLGKVNARHERDQIHFIHSDKSTVTTSVGGFFLSKFNTNGKHQWTNCSRYGSYYSQSHSMATTANSVFVTASIQNVDFSNWKGQITSTDGNDVAMNITGAAFLVAGYDYEGKLLKAVHSNTPKGGYLLPNTLRKLDNRLYLAGETDSGNGDPDSYSVFDQTLATENNDGFFMVLNDDFCYPAQPPVASAGTDTTVCAGAYARIGAAATEGTSSWTSSPAGFTSYLANPEVNPAVTTTYYLAVFSKAGLAARDTVVITVKGALAIAGADRTICAGDTAIIGAAAATGTYTWTANPAGFFSNVANPVVNPAVTTSYFLQVNNGDCTSTDTVKIFVTTPPAANAGADQVICPGSSAGIGSTVVTGTAYSWTSSPAGFTSNSISPFVSPLVTTTYFMEVSAYGCTSKDTVIVEVRPRPVADAGPDKKICTGSIAGITIGTAALPGMTYAWLPQTGLSDASTAQPTARPAANAIYSLRVTDAYGCMNEDTVQVQIDPIADITLPDTMNICAGEGTVIGVPAQAGYNYSWRSVPQGFVSVLADPYVTPTVTTTYHLLQTNTTSGCMGAADVTVMVDSCNDNVAGYTVYPNPSPGYIVIELDSMRTETTVFELVNRNGTTVLQQTLDLTTRIDLTKFTAGVYVYRIRRGTVYIDQPKQIVILH